MEKKVKIKVSFHKNQDDIIQFYFSQVRKKKSRRRMAVKFIGSLPFRRVVQSVKRISQRNQMKTFRGKQRNPSQRSQIKKNRKFNLHLVARSNLKIKQRRLMSLKRSPRRIRARRE